MILMTPRRLDWGLRVHGTDLAAWPMAERAAALSLLRRCPAARQVMAPAGEVDACQHHLARAFGKVPLDGAQHVGRRKRTARAAPLRDHAERARMVAPVLHRQEGAGVPRV